jgi:hypothetical protein
MNGWMGGIGIRYGIELKYKLGDETINSHKRKE